MNMTSFQDTIAPYVRAGWALHWLHPKSKRPIGDNWSDRPVASAELLAATFREGNNVGVRLGEPSRLSDGSYLHCIDVDIRVPDLADEAMTRLRELFPEIDSFPSVISGSGGASRHYYFTTSKPFHGRKLAVSEGKHRKPDGKWSYDYEIDLFGTGRQIVLPPSIHPDTGKPYVWERDFDFDLYELGFGPAVDAEHLEALAVAETTTYEYESREPLTFAPGQLERDLDVIPVSRLDDRDDWVTLGQALHHQFGGSDEGFDLWMRYSAKSSKFLADSSKKAELRRYRGFGRNRRKPVTMATVRLWAKDVHVTAMIAGLDDLDDEMGITNTDTLETNEFDDLLGGDGESAELDEFDAADAKAPADELAWKSLLEFNEDGNIKSTLHNLELIVANDLRLVGLPQVNLFTQETVQRRAPGTKPSRRKNPAKPTKQLAGEVWAVQDSRNGDLWSSARDYAVRSILEAPKTQGGYGVKITDRDLKAATVLAAWKNSFHPIREYLSGLKWDGKPRAEQLFIDYLGTPDTPYARETARLMLLAAVTRVFEPGHKFDQSVILEGPQGIGKSTFIRALAKHWPGELEGDFHDPKTLVEKMQGAWVLEMPELAGFNRSDVQAVKAFISRPEDRVRLAYESRAATFPRQCIFIGSTNDREYLKDPTGGRRWWPIACADQPIDIPRLTREIDQVWAEAVNHYSAMRREFSKDAGRLPLYLTDPDAAAEAARLQESRRIETPEDALAGRIALWLDSPPNLGDLDDTIQTPRTETCLAQIWRECLAGELHRYNQPEAQRLGKAMQRVPGWIKDGKLKTFPNPYGRQQRYYRISPATV